jgi:type VI protein secretion system component VasK
LKSLLQESGSYAGLVTKWLASIHLPAYEQGPFLAPIVELERIGRQNIEDVVARAWQRDVMGELSKLLVKFPFDREATEEAMPREIDALLNPVSGRFFALFRRYFEPVSEIVDGSPFRERASLRGRLAVPPDMYAMVNGVAALSSTLYDAAGHPAALPIRVATTPFLHGTDPHAALTLVYLSIADAHVYDFNQKPGLVTIRFDWTQEHTAQVGVQLTNLDTKENLYPEPINSPSSHWAVLRLLSMGRPESVKRPEGGTLYSWVVPHGTGRSEKTTARFVIVGDPWQPFSFASRLGSARTLRMPESR